MCLKLAGTGAKKIGYCLLLLGISLSAFPAGATRSLPNYRDSYGSRPRTELSSRLEASAAFPGNRFHLFPWLPEPVQAAEGEASGLEELAQYPPYAFALRWTPDNAAAYQIDPEGIHSYQLQINLGQAVAKAGGARAPGIDFNRPGRGELIKEYVPDAQLLTSSRVGNDRFLHGRPYISALGLYDHRARFYDPDTLHFIQPDPLGPVDSPNLYQAFGFDGLDVRDPWGLAEVLSQAEISRRVAIAFGDHVTALPTSGGMALPPVVAVEDGGATQTAGMGIVTIHDTAQRLRYMRQIKADANAAMKAIQEARFANNLGLAKIIAREVSEGRNTIRTATQRKLTLGGRITSEALEEPRVFEDLLKKYASDDEFETLMRVAAGSGRSRGSMRILTTMGKWGGPVATIAGFSIAVRDVAKAPPGRKVRAAVTETAGVLGGASGTILGTAACSLTAKTIVCALGVESGPAGWIIMGSSLIGGTTFGLLGQHYSRKAAKAGYDNLTTGTVGHSTPMLPGPMPILLQPPQTLLPPLLMKTGAGK